MLLDQHFQMQQLRVAIFIWRKVLCEKLTKLVWTKATKEWQFKIGFSLLTSFSYGPSTDVTEVFYASWQHARPEKMPERFNEIWTTVYSKPTTAWTQWRYVSAIFPVERWNHFETASEGSARATNSSKVGIRNAGTFAMTSPN